MGKIRDSISSIVKEESPVPKEKPKRKDIQYIPDTVEYSYDCNHCAFKRYMEALGFMVDSSNCWIDCTIEIKDEVDEVFGFILEKTFVNKQNAILYTGGVINDEGNIS